jgi:hypothetical protein
VSFKFSPSLGESCPQIFSKFGRKSPSKFLRFSGKIHFKTFFWPFLPFSKMPSSCFHLFAPPLAWKPKVCLEIPFWFIKISIDRFSSFSDNIWEFLKYGKSVKIYKKRSWKPKKYSKIIVIILRFSIILVLCRRWVIRFKWINYR